MAMDAPSLPFFASAAAAVATALAPSRVRTFLVWVTWASPATAEADAASTTKHDAVILMAEHSSQVGTTWPDDALQCRRRENGSRLCSLVCSRAFEQGTFRIGGTFQQQ